MTPKSLLRHPLAAARAADLAGGAFHPVLDDARAARQRDGRAPRGAVQRQGLDRRRGRIQRRAADDSLAVVRVEELYPFPAAELDGDPGAPTRTCAR